MQFVVSGNGPALLGMPEDEHLQLLNVNCQATNDPHRKCQINEQAMKGKSKKKKKKKDNFCTNNKVNPEADYFIAGPNMEADRATSARTPIKIYYEFSKMFTGI